MIVLSSLLLALTVVKAAQVPAAWNGASRFHQDGTSLVSAMQLAVTDNDELVIFDRIEDNPGQINGAPAWAEKRKISTGHSEPMALQSNTFCAAGGFLSNGTLVITGGDGYAPGNAKSGLQGLRLYTPCGHQGCGTFEDIDNVHLQKRRWYPGTARLSDGSLFILGGTPDSITYEQNPTYEFFPSKGEFVTSQFMINAAPDNLFPHVFGMDNDNLFLSANGKSAILNWKTHEERMLPDLPEKVVVNYPGGSAAVLLPLSPANNYQREILFCGGTVSLDGIWSGTPATPQCARLLLTDEGIASGWQTEEMPAGTERIMANGILLPSGEILLINGAKTGVAGYYAEPKDGLGYSSADNPAMRPVLYVPWAPAGERFVTDFPSAKVARMYHSSASLLPDGRIITAGSNPNPYRIDDGEPYPTEYRIEYFSPPYMNMHRPSFSDMPGRIDYGVDFQVQIELQDDHDDEIQVVLMDYGYSTHGYQYNQRSVHLENHRDGNTLYCKGPPDAGLFAPGPGFLHVVAGGIPSQGQKVMLGSGANPPVA